MSRRRLPKAASVVLLEEIIAAGGSLTVDTPDDGAVASLSAKIGYLERKGLVPEGKRLAVDWHRTAGLGHAGRGEVATVSLVVPLTVDQLQAQLIQRNDRPSVPLADIEDELADARRGLAHERTANALLDQARRWDTVQLLRRYADALDEASSSLEGDARAAAADWVGWARRYADEQDPVRDVIKPPELPPPSFADLRSYLSTRLGH